MAPFTSDETRRRRGADVDAAATGGVRGVNKGLGEPVRHLVIFAAPIIGFSGPGWGGAGPVRLAGG
jgi:hypothetical protein